MKLHHSLAEVTGYRPGDHRAVLRAGADAAIEAVVYDLAYISAAWLGKRVLFVNGAGMRSSPDDRPTVEPALLAAAPICIDMETDRLPAWSVWNSTR